MPFFFNVSDFKLNQINLDLLFKEAENFFSVGDFDGSEKILKSILENYPDHPDALNNIATILFAQNKKSESVVFLKKLLLKDPENYLIHYRCAIALSEVEQFEDAVLHCNESIRINKNYVEPYLHLATIYKFQNKIDEAKKTYEKLIESNSYYINAYLELGDLYSREEKFFEAISILHKINKLNPNIPEVHYNLGTFHLYAKNYQKAENHLMNAINLNPEISNPYANLAKTYEKQGFFYKALNIYRKDITLKKTYSDPAGINSRDTEYFFHQYHNLALALLRQGEYLEGYKYYDFRLKLPSNDLFSLKLDSNQWQEIKPRDNILILSEQGLGDSIFSSRYLNSLNNLLSEFTVQLDDRLIEIYKRTFPNINFLSKKEKIEFNSYNKIIPFSSLPSLFIKTKKDFRKIQIKNLNLNNELKVNKSFKYSLVIGISWRSISPMMGEEASIDLKSFLEVFKEINVSIVNLQYGELTEIEKNTINLFKNIEFINYDEIDKKNNIDGLLSLIDMCDYIVSIDNVTAHLAGSINKLSFVLLPINPDFRWGLNADKNDLYPSLKLFRNKKEADWMDLLRELNQHIKNFLIKPKN